MSDRWTDRLSEYLDGDLAPEERAEMESHLAACPACAAALQDLGDLVSRARGLRELDASIGVGSDLWPGIEARIRDLPVSSVRPLPERRGGGGWGSRGLFTLPQLAAACVAAIALSSAIFWVANDIAHRGDIARGAESRRATAVTASSEAARAAGAEIEALRKSLHDRRDQLDPETLGALEASVATMEAAVDDARRALDADPDNPYVQAHLDEMRARQLDLLRRAVRLAGGAE